MKSKHNSSEITKMVFI